MRKRAPTNQARKRKLAFAKKLGQAPGSVDYLEKEGVLPCVVSLFDYDKDSLHETVFQSVSDSPKYARQHEKLWLNVSGIPDADSLQEIGKRFKLHPLVLEDIVNTYQRPKLDDYDDFLYVVLRIFDFDTQDHKVTSEQVSLVLGHNFVLSFQERSTGLFAPVRERLRKQGNLLSKLDSGGLLHALIDVIVDHYFVVVESVAEEIEELEESIISAKNTKAIGDINHYKREVLSVRRAVWPTREVINSLQQRPHFLSSEVQRYFRDISDHAVHVLDMLDASREQLSGMLDIHLSTVNNRLNAEVRVLTVITTLFAPATLVTGFFGMNFHYIPWLDRSDGWLLSLALILAAGFSLIAMLFLQRWMARR